MLVLPPRKNPLLLQLEALLPRLSTHFSDYPLLEQQLYKELSGYSGERSLLYYLNLVDDAGGVILFSCRFPVDKHHFQIDCLFLTRAFAVILEVKNLRGEVSFNQVGQMIQVWENEKKCIKIRSSK